MNLINKRIRKDNTSNFSINELHQDDQSKKYFISDDDFLNISLLKFDFKFFNSYVKEEYQDESNLLWDFDKKIVVQFLKEKTNYFKNFILK